MTKLLPFLALALLATTGLALPAVAESDSMDSFDSSYQLIRLRDAGVNAVSASEDTSDTMRVTIANGDGGKATVLYDIDSLQPVRGSYDNEATGSISRAGSVNVQHSAPVVSLESLTHDENVVDPD
jgi:hypothetical protein